MKRLALWFGVMAVVLTGTVAAFGTSAALAATAPTATTSAATTVMTTSATLFGSVNLQGDTLDGVTAGVMTGAVDTTGCYFEYGSTTAYGSFISCTPTPTGGSSSAQAVAAALTGLTAGHTYHFRVVIQATSSTIAGLPGVPLVGTTEYDGGDQSFTTPSAATPPTVATTAPSVVGGASAQLNGTVNLENFAVSACSFSYSPSGGSATTIPCTTTPTGSGSQSVSASVGSGLSSGTTYSYSIKLTYNSGSTATSPSSASFTTLAATIATPSPLTSTTATLAGTVNPEGQTITACTFYYGTDATDLQTAACSVAAAQITGTANISVSASATGLTQSTLYVDTVVLTTADGALGVAPPASFTTLTEPTAKTEAATAITTTTATLHATVNLGGQGIQACGFEWGVNPLSATDAGSDVALVEPCATSPAATGNQSTSVTLKGLAPGTTYYFRIIVTTYGGYAIANTVSFKTLAVPTTKPASTAKPAMTIKAFKINKTARSARFSFARTGTTAVTKGFQCALATVTRGKVATAHYVSCKSGRTYTKLRAITYVFSVRGANANGYSRVVSHRFTI